MPSLVTVWCWRQVGLRVRVVWAAMAVSGAPKGGGGSDSVNGAGTAMHHGWWCRGSSGARVVLVLPVRWVSWLLTAAGE